jgi:uncharacterized protein YndB with AHSA1/START domain
MNDVETESRAEDLVLEYELDAPPEKVWRAISIPAFREKWLPNPGLADAEPIASVPGKEICFRMRDDEPPFLESVVTFQIGPNADGGTTLRILHALTDARSQRQPPRAANDNARYLLRAA